MKVTYDKEADAVYIEISTKKPEEKKFSAKINSVSGFFFNIIFN